MSKSRLDLFLVDHGFFRSRSQAQAAILAGLVFVAGQRVDKAGALVKPDSQIEVRGKICPYVSRGGLKLEKALEEFRISPAGLVCLDIGVSTGGFTDCLLQKGAALVYAVDVGYGQLAWKLRQDPRVVVLERTNARYLKLADLVKASGQSAAGWAEAGQPQIEKPSLVVMDVSFISILKIFPVLGEMLGPAGKIIVLIKPQFEAGRADVERGGLVKNPGVHENVLKKIVAEIKNSGYIIKGLTFSPIKGADGNIEYLGYWAEKSAGEKEIVIDYRELVAGSFLTLSS